MRVRRWTSLGVVLALAVAGCRARRYADAADTQGPLPPDTILLSTMMQTLSAQPGFADRFLALLDGKQHKTGPALITPALADELRRRILGSNWQGLDRFPGWTMREINPTVRVVGHLAGKDEKVDALATAGGAPAGTPGSPAAREAITRYLDLGDYSLTRGGTVSLDEPASGPGFVLSDYVAEVGDGVERGDGPDPQYAPLHADSQRLADVLNRLSANSLEGTAALVATRGGRSAHTPEELLAAMTAAGDQVLVADARYFANFGHLHFQAAGGPAQDVMMPFWINPQIMVPHTDRPLLVPVSHAEYEWFVRDRAGRLREAVCFYFGIDGKAEWRTMDQLNQRWVMGHHAHEYTGAEAAEVTRLAGLIVLAYAHQHQQRPKLPFGGYYALGVCQDVVAAIEQKLTGGTTLFPNTADARLFRDPRDREINALIQAIPKDRDGRPPQVSRVLGSLPVGDSDEELAAVSVPGLGADLVSVHDAWTQGTLRRVHPGWEQWGLYSTAALGCAAGLVFLWWARRRRDA